MHRLFQAALMTLVMLPFDGAAQSLKTGVNSYATGDFQVALRELKPLAEQGNTFAQIALAVMYENGEGVPQDFREAARWYKIAAEHGNVLVLNNLGLMYENGRGVPIDNAEAKRWYGLAATKGYAAAQFNLAAIFESGLGDGSSAQMAHMWYSIAFVNGAENAWLRREDLASRMKSVAIEDARRKALVCIASDYQNCD